MLATAHRPSHAEQHRRAGVSPRNLEQPEDERRGRPIVAERVQLEVPPETPMIRRLQKAGVLPSSTRRGLPEGLRVRTKAWEKVAGAVTPGGLKASTEASLSGWRTPAVGGSDSNARWPGVPRRGH